MPTQISLSWTFESNEMERILYNLDPATDRSARAVADMIVNRAQLFVPVDTGALRDSIHLEQIDLGQYQVVADMPYAGYVEFGTRRMSARPYLTPAAADVDVAIFALEYEPVLGAFT